MVRFPQKIINAEWLRLVEILHQDNYVRYGFIKATKISDVTPTLLRNHGNQENLIAQAFRIQDRKKWLPKFRGIASATSQIFLPELKGGGKKNEFAINQASRVSCRNPGIDLRRLRRRNLSRRETALVKPSLAYCPKKKGSPCPLAES